MDRSKILGEEKIGRLLLKFSIPAVIGMLINALYNIVDRIFIGRGVGSLGIAGVTIGFPIVTIIMSFAILISVGASALISIKLGEKDKQGAESILGNATALLFIASLVITTIGLVATDPLLRLFGASNTTLPYAKAYMQIILCGTIFQMIEFGMNSFIRAEGNPKVAMITMLIGTVLNIILDPLFIFVFKMGIKGAAIATVISQAVAATWVLRYYLRGHSSLKLRTTNLKLDPGIVKRIAAIGSAPFISQFAASATATVMNNSTLIYGGDTGVSAMGIIQIMSLLLLMPILGINQGIQPIISYNYGAKKYLRVKETLKLAITVAAVWGALGSLVIFLRSEQLISVFNKTDLELIQMGSLGIKIYLSLFFLAGVQIVCSGYFQAVGKPKPALFLSVLRQVVLLIPLAIILPRFFKLRGIWFSGPLSDSLAFLITIVWILRELKLLEKQHGANQDLQKAETII